MAPPIDTTEAQRVLFGTVSEDELLTEVLRLARLFLWRAYHTRYSLRSAAGFPDLVLVRPGMGDAPGRVLFAELKRAGGKLTRTRLLHDRRGRPRLVEGQVEWLGALAGCPGVETYLWLPEDLGDVATILRVGPRGDMPCVRRLSSLLLQAAQEAGGAPRAG